MEDYDNHLDIITYVPTNKHLFEVPEESVELDVKVADSKTDLGFIFREDHNKKSLQCVLKDKLKHQKFSDEPRGKLKPGASETFETIQFLGVDIFFKETHFYCKR